MAAVEILTWAMEIMDRLIARAGRPLHFAEIRKAYPALAPNTLKNRLNTLVAAGWVRKTDQGYQLDPHFVRMLHRAQQAAAESLGNLVETAKLYLNAGE